MELLPIYAYILLSALVGIFEYFLRKYDRFEYANYIHALIQALFTLFLWIENNQVKNPFFDYNNISLTFIALVTLLYPFVIYHSKKYTENRGTGVVVNTGYGIALMGFVVFITLSLLSTHLVLIWSFTEATTLCASILIYHDRNPDSLEAAWKYFFVSAIGLALAFAGILFLSIASQQSEQTELFLEAVKLESPKMNVQWLKISFLFILIGYSVKLGSFPLFTVDIDAKDTAPSPIGAVISAGLANVGFYAICTTYWIFSDTLIVDWMNHILIITGLASLVAAAVYLLKVRNIKRILAYSGVEHGGLAILLLALGKKGIFLATLHLLVHGILKSALFFQIGILYRTYKTKLYTQMGNYGVVYPVGALILIFGVLALIGFPPCTLFFTELALFKSYVQFYPFYVWLPILIFLSIIFYSLIRVVLELSYGKVGQDIYIHEQVSWMESISQILLLILALVLGLMPIDAMVSFLQLGFK